MATFVTGMHRSGTSVITGLLELCGFSLGQFYKLYKEDTADNKKGHFENCHVLLTNDYILENCGGSWIEPPRHEHISQYGGDGINLLQEFAKNFDGQIAKDPRICLTMSLWKQYCPIIKNYIFCLRNPISTAKSLQQRDGIPIDYGINLWYLYIVSFFKNIGNTPKIIVDYDNLQENFNTEFFNLTRWLKIDLSQDEIKKRVMGFNETKLNHNPITENDLTTLPEHIKKTYDAIKQRTISSRTNNAGNGNKYHEDCSSI